MLTKSEIHENNLSTDVVADVVSERCLTKPLSVHFFKNDSRFCYSGENGFFKA